MKSEKEKMLVGKPYFARPHAKEGLYDYNNLRPGEVKKRNQLLKDFRLQ